MTSLLLHLSSSTFLLDDIIQGRCSIIESSCHATGIVWCLFVCIANTDPHNDVIVRMQDDLSSASVPIFSSQNLGEPLPGLRSTKQMSDADSICTRSHPFTLDRALQYIHIRIHICTCNMYATFVFTRAHSYLFVLIPTHSLIPTRSCSYLLIHTPSRSGPDLHSFYSHLHSFVLDHAHLYSFTFTVCTYLFSVAPIPAHILCSHCVSIEPRLGLMAQALNFTGLSRAGTYYASRT